MKTTNDEFKLRVIQHVSNKFKKEGISPTLYFQTEEGRHRKFDIPEKMWNNNEYKEILPPFFKSLFKKTKTHYYALVLICTVTEFKSDDEEFKKQLDSTEIGKSVRKKLLKELGKQEEGEAYEISLTEEEKEYIQENLGEERLIIMFESKKSNSLMAFAKEGNGLKPKEHFDDSPMGGIFSNLLKE